MSWYLGPVGNLQAIEAPETFSADHSLPGGLHQTLGGTRVRDRVGAAKRSYAMSWTALTAEQFGVIRGLALGVYGPGPLILVDPGERNLLSANQSSGTDVLRDATGFILTAGSTSVDSSAVQASRGLRSLRLSIGIHAPGVYAVISGTAVSTTTATPAVDIPVLPSTAYRVSLRAFKTTSVDTFSLTMILRYFTAAGVVTGSDFTSTPTLTNNVWASHDWGGTSPSDAALARIHFLNGAATTVANTIYLDDLQMEQASAASAWVPGMGAPRVAFDDIPVGYPVIPYYDVSANLTEL